MYNHKKSPACVQRTFEVFNIARPWELLLQTCDPPHELRLEVRCFVLVDIASLSEFVQQCYYLRQCFLSVSLLVSGAEVPDEIAWGLAEISVSQSSFAVLADSLLCWFVVSHLSVFSKRIANLNLFSKKTKYKGGLFGVINILSIKFTSLISLCIFVKFW